MRRSRVSHVQEVFLGGMAAPVPATGRVGATNACVLPRLLAVKAVIQQPVRPQAFVFSRGRAGHRVAHVDLPKKRGIFLLHQVKMWW